MSISWIKALEGTIDGVNRTFFVPAAFTPVIPDSEAVFVRTLLRRKDFDDGWTVVDYATGEILLNEAPLAGDIVDAFFRQEGEESNVIGGPLTGSIGEPGELTGGIADVGSLVGCVQEPGQLCGTLENEQLMGRIETPVALIGIIEE